MEYLPVRYPPDAGELWKFVPAPGQDAFIDDFLVGFREESEPAERAAVFAALSDDEIATLLTFARRRILDIHTYRSGPLDALALIDLDRPGVPRAEVELVAALSMAVAGSWIPDEAVARALSAAPAATAELLRRPRRGLGALGYRYIATEDRPRLLRDLHPDRKHTGRRVVAVLQLAEMTEAKGYRVESISLADDAPDPLLRIVHEDPAVGKALLRAECNVVRAGPRPDGRTGRLTAYHLIAEFQENAALLAAKAEELSTEQAPVLGRAVGFTCLILASDGTDPLLSYGFALRALLASPEVGGRRWDWWYFEPEPVDPDYHTMLVMDVRYADGQAHHWWLAGPPPQGTHPDPAGAWRTLVEDGDPFRGFGISTRDFHGPEKATVRGFWRGTWVDHRFRRNVGAGAAEWARLRPFLEPEAVRAGPPPAPEGDDRQ